MLFRSAHVSSPWDSDAPVREELFGIERLEAHARSLAAAQGVEPRMVRGHPLRGRLAENAKALLAAYRLIVLSVEAGRAITPAAEWLVDNYHLIEKQIQSIRLDLPPDYYRQLPKLREGPFTRYPRVFGLAWAFIAHTDSVFDSDTLVRYARAYQLVQPLTIGELWALSVTLRVVLIENLRRLADQIVRNSEARRQADTISDRLLAAGDCSPAVLRAALSAHLQGELPGAFAVQMLHRLRDADPRVTPVLTWLDKRLAAQGSTPESVVGDILRRQGAVNVTVRNIITSLRAIADADWPVLFEQCSLVDDVLGAGSDFSAMDFETRNLYRSAIETLARGSKRAERDVAAMAVAAARTETDARASDPGYHLIAAGRPAFEKQIGFRIFWRGLPAFLNRRLGIGPYAGFVAFWTCVVLGVPLWTLARQGAAPWLLALFGLLGLVPALDVAIVLVTRAASQRFGAAMLPALDLASGIPAELRTLVAVPTLLTTRAAIAAHVERLEIHYLASPEGACHFALLSDWTDSLTEHADGDADLLAVASEGIERLNQRHGPAPGGVRFLLLHRKRVWNDSESRWIGWERKRGKLHELNRLLRAANDTSFIGIVSPLPADIRYVLTLDSDTMLPRDTIARLIGKMAHPLNRPRFSAATGRVVEGYAILQPRVTPSLPLSQDGSVFQRIFSSLSGIDPYAAAVSDLYQDLFGEGTYAGKGIYDVDAFEASLAGRVPDSRLLSHDLFEGLFARSGLASDIELVEEFPARYDVAALRHHRWARGDWQLLPWIAGRGPQAPGSSPAWRAIAPVGRWKMLDNLRRTLSAPMAVVALLAGWTLPWQAALMWTGFVVATIALAPLLPVIAAMRFGSREFTAGSHVRAFGSDARLAAILVALTIIFLAHQAALMADAIGRTVWRLGVSRRHLLEWVPAAQASSARRLSLSGFYRWMAASPALAAAGLAAAFAGGHGTWRIAALFALLWLAAPAIARRISIPSPRGAQARPGVASIATLRLTARLTWRYFERFVTAADNMLPPDNFQEDPLPAIAHRTSPTNIGLYLLSVVSARDFAWIGTGEAVTRLEATLATMAGLAQYRGHLFNWYDTGDQRALEPRYVSTVDSGNLAGHLIALAVACEEWVGRSTPPARMKGGAADALGLLRVEVTRIRDGRRTQTVTWDQLDAAITALATALERPDTRLAPTAPVWGSLIRDAETLADLTTSLSIERGEDPDGDMAFWAQAVIATLKSHAADAAGDSPAWNTRLAGIAARARAFAMGMDFAFLLDADRKLLSIGYLFAEGVLDTNCYDLLASEARLASFFAIAKGDVPARHWFRLGRAATPIAHGAALISWSGSMFEYLMPSLVMRAPAGSLLEQTTRLIVGRQIAYAKGLGLPWGISESAYNARDIEFTYQYSNFGVPGLGLKRGLAENRVIAPYATALAAMIDPVAACANFARLDKEGGRGRYGFHEALDYTPGRMPEDATVAVIRAFMAHHQGMTIVAIADTVFAGAMRARFHAEPIIQATELLLQERVPRQVSVARAWAAEVKASAAREVGAVAGRHFTTANQPSPATLLLSNGQLTTMLTASGSGATRRGHVAITRWREDATCDDHGSYIFLRDVQSGETWSAGFQPTGRVADSYSVTFHEDHADFVRKDGTLTTTMNVLVSAEDDAELRRITLTNTGSRVREVDITSYAELVLCPQDTDIAHPAFAKLFVQTEYLPDIGAVLATRRRRAPDEAEIWAAQISVLEGEGIGKPEIETDRARFLGRGRGLRSPLAMADGRTLSNTAGIVLDPIFAVRRRIRLQPGATARVAFWTVIADTREDLLSTLDRYRDSTAYVRAATLAWTQAQVQLEHLGISAAEAALFQRLAGHLIYTNRALRPSPEQIGRHAGSQSGLWGQGISGDRPIVLLRITDAEDLGVVQQMLKAREYWRLKQMAIDLVIINERQSSYVQDLQIAIETAVRSAQGGVFVLRLDLIPQQTATLLAAIARVVLVAGRGSLAEQLDRLVETAMPLAASPVPRAAPATIEARPALAGLEFFNGLGGFAKDGKEYVTILGPGLSTPAPWINVIANPAFGFQVAAEGAGTTWSINSREHQITPWSNDPVTDRAGEALYLRDEESGDVWSPTAFPIRREAGTYVARHGRGYSRFEHRAHDIDSDLVQFVAIDDPIKISRLRLTNRATRPRTLSVTAYVEWVLGPNRSATQAFVATDIDPETGALFARNRWQEAFANGVAFLDLSGAQTEWTGDRREFIGRNGTLAAPLAMLGASPLSGVTGAGLDPCGALRGNVYLPAGGTADIVFLLGDAADAAAARSLVARYRALKLDDVSADVAAHWDGLLDTITVKTPDRSMDIMLNGWLLYQALACRIWARAAFYQASGAYGFRDQLQDGMALAGIRPALARAHLLRAGARQFPEGDVQHWWLPHSGQGVRTRISDDRAWLAYATAHYVRVSGDSAVLDEQLPFLEGPPLEPGQHDHFFRPETTERTASLFEHCARALDHSLAVGAHGLPLMGTGDWNDGMNRVGEGGAGESVWLGWLLHAALTQYAPLAETRGETARADAWRAHALALQTALEQRAWDGAWYTRAFFDDGTPLGAAAGLECRIDSIAQSWAVLSGAGSPPRAAIAMASLERELIRPGDGLALLFTPPFDKTQLEPGYIKGYPPGIRENGGQYTHAALWSVMAFAALGDGETAASLFAMLNPINHARTRADMLRYKVEPYVVAADIYAVAPHVGRGGWTWYTGSACWMQRAGLESILGVRLEDGILIVAPRIPAAWSGFEITIRHEAARYRIRVENRPGPEGAENFPFSAKLPNEGTHDIVLHALPS